MNIDLINGKLRCDLSPDQSMLPRLVGGRRIATTVGESSLVWVISHSQFTGGGDASRHGAYLRAAGLPPVGAPEGTDRFHLSGVLVEPTGLLIRGEGMVNGQRITCELHQDSTRDFLSMRITQQSAQGPPRGLEAKAVDFRMLMIEHGDAVRAYVAPLLDELAGKRLLAPRAADVYRVFRDVPASVEGVAKLAELLKDLADRDPGVRRKAESKLIAGGDDVMLAAIRAPLEKLSAPQQSAIQRSVEAQQTLLDSQLDRAREDIMFLIDCLDFDDRAVREKAKAGIERYTDEKIDFDLDLEGASRTKTVEQIRLLYTRPID